MITQEAKKFVRLVSHLVHELGAEVYLTKREITVSYPTPEYNPIDHTHIDWEDCNVKLLEIIEELSKCQQ